MSTLLLVDANPMIYRGFYGGGDDPGLRDDGLPTGAVGGFLQRLWDMLNSDDFKHHRFTHQAAIFDAPGGNWRHRLASTYKATRTEQPDDLILQLKIAKHCTPHMGLHAVQQRGYEADDLIATYARLNDEDGGETVIVSGDKDLQALIRPGTVIYAPATQHGPAQWSTSMARIKSGSETISITPSQFPDLQALIGDTSDNIAGIPGIGPKTAAKLLDHFGSLERALAGAAEAPISERLRANLTTFADQARLARKLVALDDRVPVRVPLEQLETYPFRAAALIASLKALEIVAFTDWIAWKYDVKKAEIQPCPKTLDLALDQLEWKRA